jgi:putative ABC transport system ATP-binding protein
MTDIQINPLLKTRNLSKTYRNEEVGVNALQEVSLSIAPGEFVAVMGPSGCGKSTLLHLLGGLDRPTRGEIYLAGERVDNLSETAWAIIRRKSIGFVFQFFNLIGNLTVADNIELPALLTGMSSSQAKHKQTQLLSELGLESKKDAVPSQLSGGQQQRVALARALISSPAILLADEPTGNLDSQSSREVLALLKEYNARGQTILMVTHDARVATVANRLITMRDGSITDDTVLNQVAEGTKSLYLEQAEN